MVGNVREGSTSHRKNRHYRGSGSECRDSLCVYEGTETQDGNICMAACLDDERSHIQCMMEQRKLRAEIDSEIIYPKISRKEGSKSGCQRTQIERLGCQ